MSTSEHPVTDVRSGSPVWLPTALGVLWFMSLEFIIQAGERRTIEIIGLGLSAATLLLAVTWQWLADRRRQQPPDGSLGTWLIMMATIGATVFAGAFTSANSVLVRHAPAHVVAVIGSLLLVGWLHHQERRVIDPLRGRFAVFSMTVAIWWMVISLLSWSVFLSLPLWWVIGGGGAAGVLASLVVWWDAGIQSGIIRRALLPTAFISLEIATVTWWLPTAVLVSATVATTLLIFYMQVGRHLWLHTWHPGRGRRYLLAGGAVLVFVLLTARWI